MALTAQDLQTLKRAFRPNEHEFKQKYVYVAEGAVSDRIEEVDPSWTFEILASYTRDNQAVVNARLTIKGVSRDGVGMQDIKETAGEPEKGAATDALKRCARLFGIGRYLLDVPNGVTNMETLTKWLGGAQSQNTATSSRFTQQSVTSGQNAANTPSDAISDTWDKPAIETFVNHFSGRMTMSELLASLKVSRFGEWTQGGIAAYKVVDGEIAKRELAF